MQEESLSDEKINIKKLPSHYSLGEYEKIFFPKWLYKFWPYQQIFLWTLFFISVFIYLFILALANGYKVNIKLFSKSSKIHPNVKEISDIAQIYPVGGVIIKTNVKSSIILKNSQNYFNLRSGKFISLPVGKYDVKLFYNGRLPVTGKLVVGKELVYQDSFYLFREKPKLLASFPVNIKGRESNKIQPQNSLSPSKEKSNKTLYIARHSNGDIFAFIIRNDNVYHLIKIKYSKIFNKVIYNSVDITSLIAKCKKIDNLFNLNNFYYWRQNLLFINKGKLFIVNLLTKKIGLVNIRAEEYNYLFQKDSLFIFRNFDNHIIKITDGGIIFHKDYKQKGWFNSFDANLYFWKVLHITNMGTTFEIYKINKDLSLVKIQKLTVPINNFSQIGFWNDNFLYAIQSNRFILYPLTDGVSRNLANFMLDYSSQEFFSNYATINNYYRWFRLGKFESNTVPKKDSFYIYSYLPKGISIVKATKGENCRLLVGSTNMSSANKGSILVCFSDDFIIHAQRPNGVYYIENGNTKFLDGYSNVVLFTKQDNKNIYLFVKYLFIASPDIKVNSFERKNYTILGVYKGALIVFNKQKNVLQIFKL